MATPALYITDFGQLYRVTPRNWTRFLKQKAAGGDLTVSSFGRAVGVVHADVSECDRERAQSELANLLI